MTAPTLTAAGAFTPFTPADAVEPGSLAAASRTGRSSSCRPVRGVTHRLPRVLLLAVAVGGPVVGLALAVAAHRYEPWRALLLVQTLLILPLAGSLVISLTMTRKRRTSVSRSHDRVLPPVGPAPQYRPGRAPVPFPRAAPVP